MGGIHLDDVVMSISLVESAGRDPVEGIIFIQQFVSHATCQYSHSAGLKRPNPGGGPDRKDQVSGIRHGHVL